MRSLSRSSVALLMLAALALLAACHPRRATYARHGFVVGTHVEPVHEESFTKVTLTEATTTAPTFTMTADPKRPPFDARAARSALWRADVTACKLAGATGRGHASVTFAPEGKVSSVVVDTPSDLAPAARACVQDVLGKVSIAAYSGASRTIGATWVVD